MSTETRFAGLSVDFFLALIALAARETLLAWSARGLARLASGCF